MRKNKLYVLITVIIAILLVASLTIVLLFSSKCEAQIPEEEKISIEKNIEDVDEEKPVEDIPGEFSGDGDSIEEGTIPTINLEIYEGPKYSPDDGICFYRIEATVTGSPTPDIDFSKDDSGGAWGANKCQINLSDPSETYTLTATAVNALGTVTDSMDLSWECEEELVEEEENTAPVISEIIMMGTKYINRTYELGVNAVDPDGDEITYSWEISGGTIDDRHAKNINWSTPSECGTCTVSVTVSDGKGGQDSSSEDIYVHFYYDLLEKAPSANWSNDSGDSHLWNVGLDNDSGFACYRTDITLENSITYPKVLETHPQWISDGVIQAIYPDVITIPEGARFKAEIGFIEGATATNGVALSFFIYGGGLVAMELPSEPSYTYDGALDSIDMDLSEYVGRSGRAFLIVYACSSSAQDWVVFVNPRIVN